MREGTVLIRHPPNGTLCPGGALNFVMVTGLGLAVPGCEQDTFAEQGVWRVHDRPSRVEAGNGRILGCALLPDHGVLACRVFGKLER
jgi:hypothetical protein